MWSFFSIRINSPAFVLRSALMIYYGLRGQISLFLSCLNWSTSACEAAAFFTPTQTLGPSKEQTPSILLAFVPHHCRRNYPSLLPRSQHAHTPHSLGPIASSATSNSKPQDLINKYFLRGLHKTWELETSQQRRIRWTCPILQLDIKTGLLACTTWD
jgi:hypothetical protein